MSTVACQGCGMPRAAELVGVAGCPVCGHVVSPEPAFNPLPPVVIPPKKVEEPPPPPISARKGGVLAGVVTFALGAAAGVGGLLAWQGQFSAPPADLNVARTASGEGAVTSAGETVAPAPRGVSSVPAKSATPIAATTPAPPDPKATVVELDQPDGAYTVPLRGGERLVLKGRVGTLHVGTVEAGASLDASGLTAGAVAVSGKIDGGAVVRLNAPAGLVSVSGAIDGGAKVGIAGRRVLLSGGVGGAGTSVKVTIGRGGGLSVSGVQGTAVVEYQAASGGWSEPEVVVGAVAQGATFRKFDEK